MAQPSQPSQPSQSIKTHQNKTYFTIGISNKQVGHDKRYCDLFVDYSASKSKDKISRDCPSVVRNLNKEYDPQNCSLIR